MAYQPICRNVFDDVDDDGDNDADDDDDTASHENM